MHNCLDCGKAILSSYQGRVQKMRCDRCYARNYARSRVKRQKENES